MQVNLRQRSTDLWGNYPIPVAKELPLGLKQDAELLCQVAVGSRCQALWSSSRGHASKSEAVYEASQQEK